MKAEIKEEITTTFEKLNETISLFTQEEINRIPFEGSWTPGQVIRHVIKSTSGFPEVCDSNTKKLDQPADAKIASLKEIFLNLDVKYDSPDFIYPETAAYNKADLLSKLETIRNEMLNIAENYDLTLTCMDFEIPGVGNLTIYELLNFAVFHTQRHTFQLKNISSALKNNNAV
ncbi:DinB family protein [Flavobacterium fluviatile]|uniref:DinB family protein n=1 Tax=Flavobacterium fluviatile TaxID=1862387 RepID=UPI0013D49D43|nr:DinB family protein [Flavobacterium fluviatile]